MQQPIHLNSNNLVYLIDFEIQSPPFSYAQEKGLELLAQLHVIAENGDGPFQTHVKERIAKVCCKQDKIKNRNTTIRGEWLEVKRGFGERNRFFQAFADEVFTKFYPSSSEPPDELIHVTCTGYHSPSAAQKIVLQKGWEQKTMVTHAYHMGCMAALPAIRMALGYASLGKGCIDIVHTELCSLHLNPALHSDEQLVAQSLFSDGLIKYSLSPHQSAKPALRVLTVYEELIPNTEEKMKWECEDWGLKMTLSKEIPVLIGRTISDFVRKLEKRSGVPLGAAHYAIHPGGPKIIEMIGKKLHLSNMQMATSEKILYNYGNMSSATLPHIWKEMLQDPVVASGSYIVGLAFGPGLCICGTVLQKEG
jgi:predicted naringenin-chalcone synthase